MRAWQGPAEKGDPDALFNLGQAYRTGKGVKQDLRKAEELFGKAAEKNHLQAADLYGLLLFQRGERAKALPYVQAAADRGEAPAQYLLGVAHFNGDNVPKDWVRAYALTSLAQQSGLELARSALAQMDRYIPMEQRQQGVALARDLASQAQATRSRQFAAADLGATVPMVADSTVPAITTTPRASMSATAADAAAVARLAAENSPRYAGADYARPQVPPPAAPVARPSVAAPPAPPPAPRPAPVAAAPAPRPAPPAAAPAPRPASPAPGASGPWRVQLGAFAIAANANALWAKVKDRPELAGRTRQASASGRVTKLSASGFATRADAQAACSRLSAAGFACLVAQN
ncbi:MAG: tetratricopeptide repeat protein [Novosphingobium sp.]